LARIAAHGVDIATLQAVDSVSFGHGLPHEIQGAKARRWGWWYYAEYRIRTMKAYWQIIVGYGILVPILYLLAMGLGLGTIVDGHAGTVQGVSYLVFVGPSLLVASLVMECSAEFTYTIMGNFNWHRIYYGVSSSPVSPRMIAVGELVGVGLRLVVQGIAFWLILLISGNTASVWSWLTIPIGVLAAISLGAPLLAFSATRVRDDFTFSFIQRFIVIPMFLFAGTFFPIELMPGYLQWIGWISPMWHGTQLARAASFSLPLSGLEIAGHLVFLCGLAGAGVWLAVQQFHRRLTK